MGNCLAVEVNDDGVRRPTSSGPNHHSFVRDKPQHRRDDSDETLYDRHSDRRDHSPSGKKDKSKKEAYQALPPKISPPSSSHGSSSHGTKSGKGRVNDLEPIGAIDRYSHHSDDAVRFSDDRPQSRRSGKKLAVHSSGRRRGKDGKYYDYRVNDSWEQLPGAHHASADVEVFRPGRSREQRQRGGVRYRGY